MTETDPLVRYIEALKQLRETTTEGHALLKDLRAAIKEARELQSTLPKEAEARIDESVRKGLKDYEGVLTRAIETATKAVYRRFDKIAGILMGENPDEERSIAEIVQDKIMPDLPPGLQRRMGQSIRNLNKEDGDGT